MSFGISPGGDREGIALRKLAILRQLKASGDTAQMEPGVCDATFRAMAELVLEGLVAFDETAGTFTMTPLGRLVLVEMLRVTNRRK